MGQFSQTMSEAQIFALIAARLLGVCGLWWSESARLISTRFRFVFALCLAGTIWTTQQADISVPPTLGAFGLALVGEFVIGLALSLGMQLLLDAMIVAGQIISHLGGLRLGVEFDQSCESESSLARFMSLLGIVLFMVFGGHRTFLMGLLETNRIWPPGGVAFGTDGLHELVVVLTQSLSLGLQVAAPAVAAFLVASAIVHIVGRGLPQLTTMAFQSSLNALLLPATLCLSLGAIGWVFEQQVADWATQVFELIQSSPRMVTN